MATPLFRLPVWMNVCFFISDFWWNLFPQNWHGYGRVSECIRRWVDRVDDLLKLFPQILQSKLLSCGIKGVFVQIQSVSVTKWNICAMIFIPKYEHDASTCEWTALCCSRLTACPKVFPQMSQAKGLVPLCDLRTWTSKPCGVENTCGAERTIFNK